jgi:hypothetical protein
MAPSPRKIRAAIDTLADCLKDSPGADAYATLIVLINMVSDAIEARAGSPCDCCRDGAEKARAHYLERMPVSEVH